MDYLRHESARRGLVHPQARDIIAFHEAFLESIEKHGRLFEVGMLIDYKLKTGHLLEDLSLGPAMLLKGKLHLLPHTVEDRDAIASIFARARQLENDSSQQHEDEVTEEKAIP
jgi:heterodisulfide reductase subunit C